MAHLLQAEVVREILRGVESRLPLFSETDKARRSKIADMSCPHCGQSLRPRADLSSGKVFDDEGVRYVGVCSDHGVVT